jgi:hypothetical protein
MEVRLPLSHSEALPHLHPAKESLELYTPYHLARYSPAHEIRAFVRINLTESKSHRPHELRPRRSDQQDEAASCI